MTLYHVKWVWARRLRHWTFLLLYAYLYSRVFPVLFVALAAMLWALWPSLSSLRESYCLLGLLLYDRLPLGC